jgi:hypothetical protein
MQKRKKKVTEAYQRHWYLKEKSKDELAFQKLRCHTTNGATNECLNCVNYISDDITCSIEKLLMVAPPRTKHNRDN